MNILSWGIHDDDDDDTVIAHDEANRVFGRQNEKGIVNKTFEFIFKQNTAFWGK